MTLNRARAMYKQSRNVLIGENTIMTFGKYKGLTVNEIITKDVQYIKWLIAVDARHMYGEALIRKFYDINMQPLTR